MVLARWMRTSFLPDSLFLLVSASLLASVALLAPTRAAHADTDAAKTTNSDSESTDFDAADANSDASAATSQPAVPRLRVGQVTVTTTRSERDVLDVPGNVTVIDRETIQKSGARDVPDLLRREAGIFVTNTTTNPEGYTVEARGFNNGGGNGSGILVLLNGRRLNEPSSSLADWSFVYLDNIERIEIVRGPASAAYGDNAMAGVIHIITRDAEGPAQLEVRGRRGSYDTSAGSVFTSASAGPISISAFADGFKTDGYRERSEFRSRHGETTLRAELGEWGVASITGGYSSNVRKRPGDLTKALMADDRQQAEPGGDHNIDRVKERYIDGLFEIYLPGEITLKLQPFHRRRTDATEISDPFTTFSADSESDSAGINTQAQLDREIFGHDNRLLIGFDWLQEDTDSDSTFTVLPPSFFAGTTLSSTRARRKLSGIFVQNEFDLTEKLTLSLGARSEHVRYRGRDRVSSMEFRMKQSAWGPKAALTYRVSDPLSLYVSYARGFRFPNLDEAFGFFGFAPGLLPQKSDAYEIGFKWRSERASVNVAFYTMNVEQEILFNPFAVNLFNGFPGTNVNLDRVRHRGVETQFSYWLCEHVELYGSFTLDDTKITRDTVTGLEGMQLPITPRYRANAGVRVELPWWFEVTLNANFIGRRYLANDLFNTFEQLPKFTTYDGQIAFRPPISKHLELGLVFALYNFTNRRYTEFGGVSTFSGVPGFFPSPDRHYWVGIEIALRR